MLSTTPQNEIKTTPKHVVQTTLLLHPVITVIPTNLVTLHAITTVRNTTTVGAIQAMDIP